MELNKVQIQQLYTGIFLRKRLIKSDDQLTYIFELDVQDLNNIDFEIDFKGSENIVIKGYGDATIVSKQVQPRTSVPTQIVQVELHEGWKLKTIFRFLRKPISKEKQWTYIKLDVATIQPQKIMMETIFKNVQITLTPLQQLNSLLSQSKVKFVDLDFPPQEYSILGDSDKSLIDDTVNHWRRPQNIFEKKQYFLIDRLNPKNLIMGKLLDHAFFSVVCTLAMMHPYLIDKLFFNQKQVSQNGIYRLCLCKNGQWITVTVDDYIPCEPFSKPKFAFSSLNQIWICLLQKAYAKLHGRYLALHQLQVSNVFNDLTGCPTLIINLQKQDSLKSIESCFNSKYIVAFYGIQQNQFDEDEFIALKHYAYPLIGIDKQKQNDKIKRYFKFISHNQTQQQLKQDDLIKKFKYACICKVQNWQEVRIKGKFVSIDVGTEQMKNSIVMSRWYYSLQIQQTSQIQLCLHQQDLLIRNNSKYKKYKYLSMIVFQKGDKSKLIAIQPKKYAHNRQYQFSINVTPGIYLIVPILNQQLLKKKAPSEYDQVADIFRKLDLLMRRSLKFEQLEPFFRVVGETFNQSDFQLMLKTYTKDKKSIGFLAFKKMWQANRIYWEDAATNFYLRQDLFVLSIHSKQQINVLIKNNIGTDLNNRAHCEMISKYGKQLYMNEVNHKFATLTYLESKCHIVQYMMQNKYQRKITVTIDCTESVQYNFMPILGKFTFDLDSGQKRFIMKLIPKQKSDPKHLIRKENIYIKVY